MPLGISRNLLQRIVSAVLLLPPVLGSLWAGGWWFTAFLMLGGVLMAREWCGLTINSNRLVGGLLAVTIAALAGWAQFANPPILVVIAALLAITLIGVLWINRATNKSMGWWIVGFGYVGAPIFSMWWLRTFDAGQVVLWVFLIVWATDIGGYFFGKGIGGPKLAPKLSPKKTWAGLLGGMAVSVAAGIAVQAVFNFGSSVFIIAVISALLAIWAQAGDLVESGIKRHFNVKDSGELIPGHGGLLDRVDGLVFVAPAMALLLFWFPSLVAAG